MATIDIQSLKKNLVLNQGTDWSTDIDVIDQNGDVFDLSGFFAEGQMRKNYASVHSTSFDVVELDDTGRISIALDNVATSALKPGRYMYDIEITDPTGIITYLSPNSTGTNASLYNQTYAKVIDNNNVNNVDPTRNKLETRHVSGTNYTDIVATCLLDYGEPNGQDALDNATANDSLYVFDELGLVSYATSGTGRLLTHVIFHPVQKSLNRLIQIDYTVRVQSLTGFNEG